MLADCWDAAATRRCELLPSGGREATARWARRTLTHADVTVRQRIDSCQRTARWELVCAAADALEACAATWQAVGEVAGPRRLQLVRGLERRLAEHERLGLAAEAERRLDRQAVAGPARAARLAIEHLHDGTSDPASALIALEENVLAFATITIRAVQNIDATGNANGCGGRAPAPPPADLRARFAEIGAHARTLLEPHHRGDIATWLSECLIITTPSCSRRIDAHTPAATAAKAGVSQPLRSRWRRLGARELLIAHQLRPAPSEQQALDPSEIVAVAAAILADTGLAAHADAFEPELAWAHHATALRGLIPVCARAVEGDVDAGQRARRVLNDRLARVVLALWLLDSHSVRRPGTDS
jgi:hypothetical protein